MDPSKPSAAATSNSTQHDDLASLLDAICLGDHLLAPEHRQEQYRREMLAQQYGQGQELVMQELQMRTMAPMMQELQTARQFWPPHPAYYPREEVGSSSRAPVGPVGAAMNGFVGGYVPTQIGSPYQSAAGSSAYAPRASANQYQPVPSAASTSRQHQQYPIASQTGSPVPDYASIITERLRAIRGGQAPAVVRQRGRTLEETRTELLRGDMQLELVTFPDSAAHVVRLLQDEGHDDHERILRSVLAGVTRRVHDFMDHRDGHEVLAALLRACAGPGRYGEVRAIVEAAAAAHNPNERHALLRLTKHGHWETCLMELMTAAAPYADLCAVLVDRLLREGVMEHDGGDRVLHHCFATMRYEDTVILVHDAIDKFYSLLNSNTGSGSRCLVECYAQATGDELCALQQMLLHNVRFIATGKYSNYFVQHAMQYGDEEMRQRLLDHVMDDVVALSLDCYGSYVVEACFQATGQPYRVLAAFLDLDGTQLAELVQGKYSNYVVHKLLDTTMDRFPWETVALARQIDRLLPQIGDRRYTKTVMTVVRKLLTRLAGCMADTRRVPAGASCCTTRIL